ncbi:protein-l-isoaspartate o-methyltransferase [Exidia glandulosa HHB12029]|uniref:Protein-L-isoaspartate O-methyltransferase n=1 Tax=Exidia glandulosa HHB12029 TaxID=1314781 RepID=A0A165LPW5_EXIGL|nr:protein-l-isoaspartate o-methyltransferase [Exidia glandulosa HHB12029]
MAWTCSGKTNVELVLNMARAGLLSNTRVLEAMKATDRAKYMRPASARYAYDDSPQSIGHGATISAPHMHAHTLEALEPFLQPGARALDVGSGSGVVCACMARLIGGADTGTGAVVGIEHVPELVEWSRENVVKDGLDASRVTFICGDGRKGYPSSGPYDAIHVGAAAPSLCDDLVDQLKAPGRMFIPVGTDTQEVVQVDKDAEGNVTKKTLFGVMYVPLTELDKQLNSGRYS